MEEMNKNSDKMNKIDKKRLFTILPYNYPEVYVTHLNNLV